MAKIPYPISANYIKNWGPLEGLRELIANGFDGEAQSNAKFTWRYDYKKRSVILTNEGVSLSRDVLMFGESSKSETEDGTIGQFGEGMKLGCLVLVRERFDVKIRNGRFENWIPSIEMGDHFSKPTLVINITKAARQVEDFEIEISNVDRELWDRAERLFLKMQPGVKMKSTPCGDLIDDPEQVGHIYVRGVFHGKRDNMSYGFNFLNIKVDRDRRLPDNWDTDYHMAQVFGALVQDSPTNIDAVYKLMNTDKPEAEGLGRMASYSALLQPRLVAHFKELHGDAVPVDSTEAAMDLEHYGIKTVVLKPQLVKALTEKTSYTNASDAVIPTAQSVKQKRRYDIVKTYEPSDLTVGARKEFERVAGIVKDLIPEHSPRISVVEFMDPKLMGLWNPDRSILLARHVLDGGFGKTLMTVLHELAHDSGPDGSPAHINRIQALAEKAFDHLG